jgi:hypothetical protein
MRNIDAKKIIAAVNAMVFAVRSSGRRRRISISSAATNAVTNSVAFNPQGAWRSIKFPRTPINTDA